MRHMHQSDFACLPLELYAFEKYTPEPWAIDAYLLNSHLLISFFNKIGFGYGNTKEVDSAIKSMAN